MSKIKSELHQIIDQIGDDKLLEAVYALLSSHTVASDLDGKPLTQEEFEAMIDEGEDDILNGRVYTLEEVKAHFRKKMNG